MSESELPLVRKTPGVCGGRACVRGFRLPVWQLVLYRKLGGTCEQTLRDYPFLTPADLDAAWAYYRQHPLEIEQDIWWNDTAGDVIETGTLPVAAIVEGKLLGLSDTEVSEGFDPPLSQDAITAAWTEYRRNPSRFTRLPHTHQVG